MINLHGAIDWLSHHLSDRHYNDAHRANFSIFEPRERRSKRNEKFHSIVIDLTLSLGRLARRFFNLEDEELVRLIFVVDDEDDKIELDELSRSQSESVCSLGRFRSFD